METFLYSGYLLLWLLCRSYSVLSCSSQSILDIRVWFIEGGNVDIITLLIVFHYCLYVSSKMSHATIMMNPSLASNFKTNLKQLRKKTVSICFEQKPLFIIVFYFQDFELEYHWLLRNLIGHNRTVPKVHANNQQFQINC